MKGLTNIERQEIIVNHWDTYKKLAQPIVMTCCKCGDKLIVYPIPTPIEIKRNDVIVWDIIKTISICKNCS